jgi:hypothetical protein
LSPLHCQRGAAGDRQRGEHEGKNEGRARLHFRWNRQMASGGLQGGLPFPDGAALVPWLASLAGTRRSSKRPAPAWGSSHGVNPLTATASARGRH